MYLFFKTNVLESDKLPELSEKSDQVDCTKDEDNNDDLTSINHQIPKAPFDCQYNHDNDPADEPEEHINKYQFAESAENDFPDDYEDPIETD